MNKILASFVLATMTTSAFAQSNTNSPYSQFGLGDLTDQSVGFNKGMNGVGLAMRRGNEVNTMNPASYSAVDSLTMLFDAGLSGQITNYKENGKKMNGKSGGFDYVVGQFRAFKGVGVTFGVLPYSNIGYNYSQSEYLNDASITKMTTTNKGDGGMHQLFIGTGIRLFKPLSIGANLSYLWGDYNRSITSSSSASNVSALQMLYTSDISSYKLDLGMQLELPLSKLDNITLGATWTPGHSLKADAKCSVINSNSTISKADTTAYKLADALSIPTSFGFGLAYNHGQQFRMGADFTMQKWGSVDYPSFDSQAKTYTMKSGLLKDTFDAARIRFAENGTFNAFKTNYYTTSRIDHVFVSPATTVDAYGVFTNSYWTPDEDPDNTIKASDAPQQISFDTYIRHNPSDHYQVFVKVKL